METISIVEVKTHLSEIVAKSAYNNERFIMTKANKPVAALVSIEDLTIIEQHCEKAGLAEVASKWTGFDEVAEELGDLSDLRSLGEDGRNVSL